MPVFSVCPAVHTVALARKFTWAAQCLYCKTLLVQKCKRRLQWSGRTCRTQIKM